MLQSRHLFYALIILTAFSCKKENQPDEPVACNSVDWVTNDTFPVLFVVKENGNLAIHQLKNGVETSVISSNQFDFWWPKFSPDKNEILCYRSPDGDATQMNDYTQAELWKFNADGSGGHKILSLSDFGWNATGFARWAPNGKRIVMAASNEDASDNNNIHWHLYITDSAGNNPQKISTRSAYFTYPDISSDYSKITYCAYPSPVQTGTMYEAEAHVALLDTTTWTLSSEVRITNDTRADENTTFNTNGTLITFYSSSGAGDFSMHTCNSAGADLNSINTAGRYMSQPVFMNTNTLLFVLKHGTYCLNHLVKINIAGTGEITYLRKLNMHYFHPDL